MSSYRDATLKHMNDLWDNWRCEINLKHIKPHMGNLVRIKADKPHEILQEDWDWLITHRFSTDRFKKMSTTNSNNRKNVLFVHHSGSKPFSQVQHEMELRYGHPPTFEDVFLETRKQKDKTVDPTVQLKVDEMRAVRLENPSISNINLADMVFGHQKHGSVIEMGGGVLPSQLRNKESQQSFHQENIALKNELQKLADHQKAYEARTEAKLKAVHDERLADKAEFEKRLAIIMSFMSPNSSMPPTSSMPPSVSLHDIGQTIMSLHILLFIFL
ncbi:uncharacterized protein LOC124915340 [Impatiens glandulifera]|uniref:uncharacterized protein LOC124915340 n=1 Tax=Impatiens glandulifera TaxID=253017 RepID=UPI001FB17A2B|nr:uncharacterized protein LOC124915340 [Impatiens glandulifera]